MNETYLLAIKSIIRDLNHRIHKFKTIRFELRRLQMKLKNNKELISKEEIKIIQTLNKEFLKEIKK